MSTAIDGLAKLCKIVSYSSELIKKLDLPLVGYAGKTTGYLSHDRVTTSALFSLGAREVNESILLNSDASRAAANAEAKKAISELIKSDIIGYRDKIAQIEKEKQELLDKKSALEYVLINDSSKASLIDFLKSIDELIHV